ncbi:unnamed protein product [Eruca vesicaria subsp. sativa]|uniref:Uncharacterized protein n=1 Tax=Eruca vesicaria subsp. sativa TaxID=29727 RepID=A0ABC8JR55_ERUVS|nr:unnamed protein product [Eruca vesicaria subsp. sativa]
MRLQLALKKDSEVVIFFPVDALDREHVVPLLPASDKTIHPIVDMSVVKAPRVFFSHGVIKSITVASLGARVADASCST